MPSFFYKVNGVDYPVIVTYKKIKKIYYRFSNGYFKISCPHYVKQKELIKGLDEYGVFLVERSKKYKTDTTVNDEYMYIYGVKVYIYDQGEISFTDNTVLKYSSRQDLEKKLMSMFLSYLKQLVEYYSYIMNVPLYNVKVKKMKTRIGSNSLQTKTLSFSLDLMQYSSGVIESVVVHELAHILVYNHSKEFYNVVYKYCPDYDYYRKKIVKRDYQ